MDHIKIDGLFIQGLVGDPLDRQVVPAISRIVHCLGKATVAELVETPEAIAIARECVDMSRGTASPRPGPARAGSAGRDAAERLTRPDTASARRARRSPVA